MTYLLFYKGTRKENPSATLWDRFICFVTRSRFSHVELAFMDAGNVYMCWSSSSRDGGVRYARIFNDQDHWVIVPISLSETDEWFYQHKGKAYDYIGLLGTVIKLPWFSSKNKWFCSEIIAEYLKLNKSWSITPDDLYKIYK